MRVMDWLRLKFVRNGILSWDDDHHDDAEERARLRRELDEIGQVVRELMTERGLIQHREPEGRDRDPD